MTALKFHFFFKIGRYSMPRPSSTEVQSEVNSSMAIVLCSDGPSGGVEPPTGG